MTEIIPVIIAVIKLLIGILAVFAIVYFIVLMVRLRKLVNNVLNILEKEVAPLLEEVRQTVHSANVATGMVKDRVEQVNDIVTLVTGAIHRIKIVKNIFDFIGHFTGKKDGE